MKLIFQKGGFVSLLLWLGIFQAHAVIRYVKPVTAGHGLGIAWDEANSNLQFIITISQPGDEIWVAAGTYKTTSTTDRNISFLLKNGVSMYGGFAGTENSSANRNIAANPTILSGDIDPNGENDSYHVVIGNQVPSSPSIFDGFIVTGGRATGNPQNPSASRYLVGAGMYITGLQPIIRNCTFTDNIALFGGAALFFSADEQFPAIHPVDPIVENCRFFNNIANVFGGGLLAQTVNNLSVKGCQFHDNNAMAGAGIYTLNSAAHIEKSIFYHNSADAGAAMFLQNSNNTIYNSTFWANSATQSGGAVGIDGAGDVFTHCTFAKNIAQSGASFFLEEFSTTTINNSILWSDNSNSLFYFPADHPNISYSIVKGGYAGCVNCPGGNGNVNPHFMNELDLDGADDLLPSSDDGLRLSSFSPAMNAAPFNTNFKYDILGSDRFPDTINDYAELGAYENPLCTTALARLYVDDTATGGSTGASWADALPNLRMGLNIANTCPTVHEIWVAKGIYKPTDTHDRNFSFNLQNNVVVYGGFAGNETLLSQRIWQHNPTILSGDISPNDENDSYHVVINNDKNASTAIDGFTITGGRAIGTTDQIGAGMLNKTSPVTVRNCIFKDNIAQGNGGGMYNKVSDTQIINCIFTQNSSNQGGGGLFNFQSDVFCQNTVFANNTAVGFGGAVINNSGSNSVYINCTIVHNTATMEGDGMQNTYGSNPAIINSILYNNGTVAEANKEINNVLSSTPTVSYSVVEGGYAGCAVCPPNGTNPQFLDATNTAGADGLYATADDGLALSATSPLVDQGLNTANGSPTDVAGNNRTQGTNINIGAYETGWVLSTNTGMWSNVLNWNVARLPNASDYVFIKDNHHILIDIPVARAHYLIIAPDARLTIPQSSFIGSYKLSLE